MRALLITSTVSVALAVAGVASSATTAQKPALRFAGRTVQGRYFHPRETVRVTVGGTFQFVRVVRTTAVGAFAIDLPQPLDPCNAGLFVTASSTRGESAVLKLPPRLCPPP
jgi:hypothetical protein